MLNKAANALRQTAPTLPGAGGGDALDGMFPGLQSDLAKLTIQPPWLPIESAPKDALIIGHNELWVGAPSILEWDEAYQNWFIHDHGEQASPQPTFWMPVPAKPIAHHDYPALPPQQGG